VVCYVISSVTTVAGDLMPFKKEVTRPMLKRYGLTQKKMSADYRSEIRVYHSSLLYGPVLPVCRLGLCSAGRGARGGGRGARGGRPGRVGVVSTVRGAGAKPF
jgi:hypothetical protein